MHNQSAQVPMPMLPFMPQQPQMMPQQFASMQQPVQLPQSMMDTKQSFVHHMPVQMNMQLNIPTVKTEPGLERDTKSVPVRRGAKRARVLVDENSSNSDISTPPSPTSDSSASQNQSKGRTRTSWISANELNGDAETSAVGGKGTRGAGKRTRGKGKDTEQESDDPNVQGKRDRNKVSAAKYRKRRKAYLDGLEKKVEGLQDTIADQGKKLSSIVTENKVLKSQLDFFKELLGRAKIPLPSMPTAGTTMFVILACFILVAPTSTQHGGSPGARTLLGLEYSMPIASDDTFGWLLSRLVTEPVHAQWEYNHLGLPVGPNLLSQWQNSGKGGSLNEKENDTVTASIASAA